MDINTDYLKIHETGEHLPNLFIVLDMNVCSTKNGSQSSYMSFPINEIVTDKSIKDLLYIAFTSKKHIEVFNTESYKGDITATLKNNLSSRRSEMLKNIENFYFTIFKHYMTESTHNEIYEFLGDSGNFYLQKEKETDLIKIGKGVDLLTTGIESHNNTGTYVSVAMAFKLNI